MLVRKVFVLIILTAAAALTGCGQSTHDSAITGVITHSHTMTIPVGFVITVRIEDITRANAPGKKISEQVIKSQGEELPMPFSVVYDPGKINPNHKYSLTVKISDTDGKLLYTNNTIVPVITNGDPTHDIEVIVVLVDG